MNPNSLLRIRDLSKDELMGILMDAQLFGASQKDWQLPQRRLVANLFFEPSTRTHYSFASAEHQLGCCVEDFTAVGSSHRQDEYFRELEGIEIPIINAGDGAGNHPTQCLLDLLTLYQEFGRIEGIRLAIIGDIQHSRVASSNREAMELLGGEWVFSGPPQWQREGYPYMPIDEAVEWADAVMMLRIQHERHASAMQMSKAEYLQRYGLTKERASRMKPHAIIMHPAPVNRDVEIDSDLVESPKSRIFKQMSNGVLIRKAAIKRAMGVQF